MSDNLKHAHQVVAKAFADCLVVADFDTAMRLLHEHGFEKTASEMAREVIAAVNFAAECLETKPDDTDGWTLMSAELSAIVNRGEDIVPVRIWDVAFPLTRENAAALEAVAQRPEDLAA